MYLGLLATFDQQNRGYLIIFEQPFYPLHLPMVVHASQVDGQNVIGMSFRNFLVDIGVMFSAIADQNKF